ncbi:MAG: 50S ribosomal protein L13 [Patescibacteria group bacterium]|jgi:large subunit ribosomal protein L13
MNKITKHAYGLKKETHHIDATGLAVGRIATKTAGLLMGKNKPGYSPHTDCGDFVEITNADKVKFTGKKLSQKVYYRHTHHPGGLKIKKMKELFDQKPEDVIRRAVSYMLPKNRLQKLMLKRLKFKK